MALDRKRHIVFQLKADDIPYSPAATAAPSAERGDVVFWKFGRPGKQNRMLVFSPVFSVLPQCGHRAVRSVSISVCRINDTQGLNNLCQHVRSGKKKKKVRSITVLHSELLGIHGKSWSKLPTANRCAFVSFPSFLSTECDKCKDQLFCPAARRRPAVQSGPAVIPAARHPPLGSGQQRAPGRPRGVYPGPAQLPRPLQGRHQRTESQHTGDRVCLCTCTPPARWCSSQRRQPWLPKRAGQEAQTGRRGNSLVHFTTPIFPSPFLPPPAPRPPFFTLPGDGH